MTQFQVENSPQQIHYKREKSSTLIAKIETQVVKEKERRKRTNKSLKIKTFQRRNCAVNQPAKYFENYKI